MLSKNIKRFRRNKGYSQEKLSEKAGVSLRTVQRLENGETDPTGDTLTRIAEALEVTPDDLLEWQQAEDTTYLKLLNYSALSIWILSFLGIIVPLLLWITKRDKIKKVDKIGKELINFQLTWIVAMTFYVISYAFLILYPHLNVEIDFFPAFSGLLLFYFYNTALVIYNAIRAGKNKDVWYHPRINFMR